MKMIVTVGNLVAIWTGCLIGNLLCATTERALERSFFQAVILVALVLAGYLTGGVKKEN